MGSRKVAKSCTNRVCAFIHGGTYGERRFVMSPEDYPVYWKVMKLYGRIRFRLGGFLYSRYDSFCYLVLVRLVSPDKRCALCLKKVELSEVLRNPEGFCPDRHFADNGEQLYSVVSHKDCTPVWQ